MTQVDQHAGLHRVAALLGGDSPEAVFAAAVEELAQVVDHETGQGHSEMALIARYEDDRTFTVLESWGERGGRMPRNSRRRSCGYRSLGSSGRRPVYMN